MRSREDNIKVSVRPIFVAFKKHYCWECDNLLKKAWIIQYIEKGSLEEVGKFLQFGYSKNPKPIKYSFRILECDRCKINLSIHDVYYIKKPRKKNKVKYDDYHQYLQNLDRKDDGDRYFQYLTYLDEIVKKFVGKGQIYIGK